MADGRTDAFYVRFTSSKQSSLILGTSRAAQGLQPSIFKEEIGLEIFNYSFTIAHSPYGPTYFNSIQKKLDSSSKNGTFILTVDPWSLSSVGVLPNDTSSFRENSEFLANLHCVNAKPNLEYLVKHLHGSYYNVLKRNSSRLLHQDGWFEVELPLDLDLFRRRTEERLKVYREKHLHNYHFSTVRLNYLKKTISYLQSHGEVYLVRLPIHKGMLEIENELMPDFNEKVESLSDVVEGYYDMTPLSGKFIYTDGNHLHRTSGKEVSRLVSKWIKINEMARN